MNQPLTFDEWKEKHSVVDTSQLANNISEIYGGNADDISNYLNDCLCKDYEFYLSRFKDSN